MKTHIGIFITGFSLQSVNLFQDESEKLIEEHGNKMEQNKQHTHNQSIAKMCDIIFSEIRQHFGNKMNISAQKQWIFSSGTRAFLPGAPGKTKNSRLTNYYLPPTTYIPHYN